VVGREEKGRTKHLTGDCMYRTKYPLKIEIFYPAGRENGGRIGKAYRRKNGTKIRFDVYLNDGRLRFRERKQPEPEEMEEKEAPELDK
jgi:hypothetical protein